MFLLLFTRFPPDPRTAVTKTGSEGKYLQKIQTTVNKFTEILTFPNPIQYIQLALVKVVLTCLVFLLDYS